ncbi:hypothetical protein [Halioxenophilus aromaticivorans]|uniref:Chemotaxis protein CheC n=1 Tax=Halioxenophilus aromaticivorans TaxID=1306992 RepID=A0AAV3U0A7_9ALTE
MKNLLSEDDQDALRETCNLAMGAGGEALFDFTGQFVTLSIPKIQQLGGQSEPRDLLAEMGSVNAISVAAQEFSLGQASASALCVACSESLAVLENAPGVSSSAVGARFHQQMSQVLICTALRRFAEVLELELALAPLQLLHHNQPWGKVDLPKIALLGDTLSVEMNYRLESHVYNASLVFCLPEPMQTSVLAALHRLMA